MRKLIASFFVTALLLSPHSSNFLTKAGETARARGVIRAVDPGAGTVAIHTRNDETVVLSTNERTQIVRNGERAPLEDLQQGDHVVALYDPATKLALEIEARGEDVENLARGEGVITAVDTAASTVTIEPLRPDNPAAVVPTVECGASVTLHVNPNTQITLDGNPARLDELKRGFSAGASYRPQSFEAARIAAESFPSVRGVIRNVNLVDHTITIQTANGAGRLTLGVGPDTPISLNDRPASLEDLRRGYRVLAVYVEATLQAIRIVASSLGEVAGHIRVVDVPAALVVITPLVDGPAVELHVLNSTVITIGGERAPLARLQPGMAARAVYDIVSFNAVLIEARPLEDQCTELRVRGRIAEVNLHASTVTINPGDTTFGERLTLNVLERTEITINGRPARLSELSAGMRAVAVFCRESLIAKSIAARANDE